MSTRPVQARAANRAPLDARALLDATHAGVEHSPLGGTPWLYLDLDALRSVAVQHHRRLLPWLRSRPCPVIGLSNGDSTEMGTVPERGLSPFLSSPLASACDLIVADDSVAQALLDNVEHTPLAAMTLVQVMRATEYLPIAQGLLVGSLGYATLQAGPEYRAWLAAQPRRAPTAPAGPPLRIARAGRALTITLARPERRNALSLELRDALTEALELAAIDSSIESVLIEADGPDFCAGGDLAEFGTAPDPAIAHAVRSTRLPAAALVTCRDRVSFRVQGACVGAGAELAAFGREVTAREDSWFRLPELGFGLIPGAGGCVSVVRRVGRQRATWLALSGRRIDASTALQWGLVDSVM